MTKVALIQHTDCNSGYIQQLVRDGSNARHLRGADGSRTSIKVAAVPTRSCQDFPRTAWMFECCGGSRKDKFPWNCTTWGSLTNAGARQRFAVRDQGLKCSWPWPQPEQMLWLLKAAQLGPAPNHTIYTYLQGHKATEDVILLLMAAYKPMILLKMEQSVFWSWFFYFQ